MSIMDNEYLLRTHVSESISISEVLRKFELDPRGCNFKTFKKYITKYDIDTSHLKGQSHGKSHAPKPLSEVLTHNSYISSAAIKKRLLSEGLLTNKCYICNLIEWCGGSISLHMDHIDGNPFNNELQNLRMLCPNCHSQTKTYAGRNIKNSNSNKTLGNKTSHCQKCNNPCCARAKFCDQCYKSLNKEKIVWPDIDEIIQLVKSHGSTGAGKILGVSANAVSKHLKLRGVPKVNRTPDAKV